MRAGASRGPTGAIHPQSRPNLLIRSVHFLLNFTGFMKSHLIRHFSFARREGPVHKGALRGTDPATKTRKPGSRNWRKPANWAFAPCKGSEAKTSFQEKVG